MRKCFASKCCIVNKTALIQCELRTSQERLVTDELSILGLFTCRKLNLGGGGKVGEFDSYGLGGVWVTYVYISNNISFKNAFKVLNICHIVDCKFYVFVIYQGKWIHWE